jgi:hypothetical protein
LFFHARFEHEQQATSGSDFLIYTFSFSNALSPLPSSPFKSSSAMSDDLSPYQSFRTCELFPEDCENTQYRARAYSPFLRQYEIGHGV